MICASCKKDAMFEYRLTRGKSIFYCGTHLPRFLEPQRKAGLLKITESHATNEASALAALSGTPVTPVEEPEVTEDVSFVETPVTTTTVKKTTKKSAK
jgi:hypothetical protein